MKATRIITALVTIAFILPAISVLAQSPPPGPGGGGGVGAPIDGGAIALLASAAAYGYRKIKERKQAE